MRAGMLNERVRIEAKDESDDDVGGQDVSWTEVDTVWAEVMPVSGEKKVFAQRIEASARYTVKIRNRDDLDPTMRLVWLSHGDVVLNIREMPYPGGRAPMRALVAEEGVAT